MFLIRKSGVGIKTYRAVIVHIGSCRRFTALTGPGGEFGTTGYSYSNDEKCQWKIELDGNQVIFRTVCITPIDISKHALLTNAMRISQRPQSLRRKLTACNVTYVAVLSGINATFGIWRTADAQRPC